MKDFKKIINYGTEYDLEDTVLFNIFKQRLGKFIGIKKSICEIEKSIRELEKENENLYDKLNQNKEKITDLEVLKERILEILKSLKK